MEITKKEMEIINEALFIISTNNKKLQEIEMKNINEKQKNTCYLLLDKFYSLYKNNGIKKCFTLDLEIKKLLKQIDKDNKL